MTAALPLLVAPLLIGATPLATPSAEPLVLQPIETQLLAETNAARARAGLRPVQVDMNLLHSARRHASWMARNRRMQHAGLPVAENVAMGQRSANQVVRTWLNSPGHRANLLNPRYTRIGVAAYQGGGGTIFWCQQFVR